MYFIVKIFTSALVIALVSELSKKSTFLSAFLVSLPLISILSFIWIYLDTKDPNKLKVYTDGYDGHCLRATAYFGESMPDIELAPAGAECYAASIDGTSIYFHSEEDVEYLGTSMKGKELYDLMNKLHKTQM